MTTQPNTLDANSELERLVTKAITGAAFELELRRVRLLHGVRLLLLVEDTLQREISSLRCGRGT